MSVTNEFKVEIVTTADDGVETIVAPALSSAIQGFERSALDEDDDEEDDSFLVSRTEQADENKDDEDEEDESDPDDEEDSEPEAQLFLMATVSKEVMDDINMLCALNDMIKIRFNYGAGVIVREFEVDSDLWLSLNEGKYEPTALCIGIGFDVYDSSTHF